jgi:hypothetical protein
MGHPPASSAAACIHCTYAARVEILTFNRRDKATHRTAESRGIPADNYFVVGS